MEKLADIFSSHTRVKILRILSHQSRMPIRHIAYLVGGAIFSVQYALKKLVAEKIVLRSKSRKRPEYTLNKEHTAFPFILQVFECESKLELQSRSRHLYKDGAALIRFCDSSRKLFSRAKGAEDMIISKLESVKNAVTRFRDLADLQSIFAADHHLDVEYLYAQMQKFELKIPTEIKKGVPGILLRVK